MKISDIKRRADEVLLESKPQLTRIFVVMMLIQLIPVLFASDSGSFLGLISFALTIVFLTFQHGYIVSTLKAVRHNPQAISDDDSYVGLTRYKELFFTYFLSAIIIGAISFVLIFIFMFIFIAVFGMVFANLPSLLTSSSLTQGNIYSQLSLLINFAPQLIFILLLMGIIIWAVVYILSIYMFAMPYLLEQYHMTAGKALNESFSLMRGHAFDFFKLTFSFFGWMILAGLIQGIIASLLAFIPVLGNVIAVAVSGLFGIYTYSVKYAVCRTIFFEEIAYYRYDLKTEQVVNEIR